MRVGVDTKGDHIWITKAEYEVLKEDHKYLQGLLDRLVSLTGTEDYEEALDEVELQVELQAWR